MAPPTLRKPRPVDWFILFQPRPAPTYNFGSPLGSCPRPSCSWPCPQSRPVAPAPPRRLPPRPRPGPYRSRGASRRERRRRGGERQRGKGEGRAPHAQSALTVRGRRFATNGPTTPGPEYRNFSLQKLSSKMEVLEKPCRVSRGTSESQRMASRASAGGRGCVAKVQLGSVAASRLPCADAVAAAAAAAAATAFAATVSAAAVPALPPGASIVPAVLGPETGQPRGFRKGRRPPQLKDRGAGGTGSGRGQRGNPREPGQSVGRQGVGVARSAVSGIGAPHPRPVFPRRPPLVGSEPRRAPSAMSPDSRWPVSAGQGRGREWPAGKG